MTGYGIKKGSVTGHLLSAAWATLVTLFFFFPSPVYAATCEFRYYRGATYASGMFVCVGYCIGSPNNTSFIITTPDGYTPFEEPYIHTGVGALGAVTYGDGRFVAVGESEVAVSFDGTEWTGQYDITVGPTDVVYANSLFVCPAAQVMLTSPKAAAGTWTERPLGDDRIRSTLGVAYGNGKFVAVGTWYDKSILNDRPFSVTSEDGIGWVTHLVTDKIGRFCSVAFSGSTFVATASQSLGENVYTSSDGVDWTPHRIGPESDAFYPYRVRKTWAGFVAVGRGASGTSSAYLSTNGVVWTAIEGAGSSWLYDVNRRS